MNFFERLNVRSTVKSGIDTKEMEFAPLKDFCGSEIVVDGFFFTNGRFGKQVVVVGNGYLINMPSRAVKDFELIADYEEAVEDIFKGKLKLTNIRMIDTKNGTTTAYEYKSVK